MITIEVDSLINYKEFLPICDVLAVINKKNDCIGKELPVFLIND
jgi:ribosome-associated toxin RatA of RatAB toxin-antitoxin module